jgi:gamma-glutamyltranspeptidase / glutathione hydrolase
VKSKRPFGTIVDMRKKESFFKGSVNAALCFTLLFLVGCASSGPRYAVSASTESRKITEARGINWVVSTQGRAASDAVARVFSEGGNIIDAAVAASFTIGVERPQSTGIGGGGFMLYREAKTGKIYAIDFRERAPSRAREKMYLDEKGKVLTEKSITGIYAAGVPGLVKGLSEIHAKFGRLPWKKLLLPAISLADSGVEVYPHLAEALLDESTELGKNEAAGKIFKKPDGSDFKIGEKIYQPELAGTLRQIAEEGSSVFYHGHLADSISSATQGWISKRDLKNYKVRWLKPVRSKFLNYEIVSMPPPSSGGVHLIQILKILESDPLEKMGFQSVNGLHLIASAMQRAFVDRARYLGDPDWVKVPIKTLISDSHISKLRSTVSLEHATAAEKLSESIEVLPEHSETTHFSIMDREGNVVVSTQTINGWFGSKFVVPGTGILLNNEMDDFSAQPGASNLFGAVGSKANSVQPGKTPLSSMTPTIVLENGVPRLALGAPGGTRIITCVAQTILNALVYHLPLYESVNALRIHQQWKPDVLRIEAPGFGTETESELEKRGWKIEKKDPGCAVMAVSREGDVLHGVSEPRDHGKALAQ